MDRKTIGYWIATALLVVAMGYCGVMDLWRGDDVRVAFAKLGYPEYLLTILGIAKLLGLAAVLAPGFRRLKEWAYAGFVIDVVGAFFSHLAIGDTAELPAPVIVLVITLASWWLRPESRRL